MNKPIFGSDQKFHNTAYWTICAVCNKDAPGCGLIFNEPQLSLHNKVLKNNLQRALYFQPRGNRMHPACIEKLKSYFAIRENHATTSNPSVEPRRPILTLKKQNI